MTYSQINIQIVNYWIFYFESEFSPGKVSAKVGIHSVTALQCLFIVDLQGFSNWYEVEAR